MENALVTIEQILAQMNREPFTEDGRLVRRLLCALRPRDPRDVGAATVLLEALTALLQRCPDYAEALRRHVIALLLAKNFFRLLLDSGILSERGFGKELSRRLRFRLLPLPPNPNSLRDWTDRVFLPKDQVWIEGIDPGLWERLLAALDFDRISGEDKAELVQRMETVVVALSHQIAAGGLNPELLRLDPSLDEYDSPFLAQYEEINAWLRGRTAPDADASHARVLLAQCVEVLDKIRRRAHTAGTSVELTYAAIRLEQQIQRLEDLLTLLEAPGIGQQLPILAKLLAGILAGATQRYSPKALIAATTGRLAYQITKHVAHTGQHYVAESPREHWTMFLAAAGAGPIIALMALLKIRLQDMHYAPLSELTLVSLDYALGFVIIYMLHFTVATKQPAMTATFMVNALQQIRSNQQERRMLVCFVGRVFKSQMMSILGNLFLAFGTAFALAYAAREALGWRLVEPAKALQLLQDVQPFTSLALFYAGVAGVGLFLSGVVSGYYDNKAVYEQVSERLARLRWAARVFGPGRWRRMSEYAGDHLGGIMGNAFFGLYLGLFGALGKLTGLPLDIRHIAFSAANTAYAWQSLNFHAVNDTLALALAGVLLIGFANLMVSFGLAFYVALRATRTPPRRAAQQLGRALLALLAAPLRLLTLRGDRCDQARLEKAIEAQESAHQ